MSDTPRMTEAWLRSQRQGKGFVTVPTFNIALSCSDEGKLLERELAEATHQMEKYAADAKSAIEAHESACRELTEAREKRDALVDALRTTWHDIDHLNHFMPYTCRQKSQAALAAGNASMEVTNAWNESPWCQACKEANCVVSHDGTCAMIRKYLKSETVEAHRDRTAQGPSDATACSVWRDPRTDPPTKTGRILVWVSGCGPHLVNVEERWMAYWDGQDETEPTMPDEWEAWAEIAPPNAEYTRRTNNP